MAMKKRGKIVPISLDEHLDLLALVNETVGGSAGSSEKENLLPRIYRKWKHALPNLEEAPLFKVLGRRKENDGLEGKSYPFTEQEKDQWSNLFAYIGSEEKRSTQVRYRKDRAPFRRCRHYSWRLTRNGDAWEGFIDHLRAGGGEPGVAPNTPILEAPRGSCSQGGGKPDAPDKPESSVGLDGRRSCLVLAGITLAVWKTYSNPAPLQVASVARMTYPLPDKPSIAVLAFTNMSGDPKDEFFGDGLLEGIINGLSKCEHLFVIARKSTSIYKGKPVKVKQVAEEMGVRKVMTGSFQREGNRVRINAQLIDALTGKHLFSERYDRSLKEMLKVQDEITLKVLTAVQVKLTAGEHARWLEKGTENLEAYLKVLQERDSLAVMNREKQALARHLAEEAITLDPRYPAPYAVMAELTFYETPLGVYKNIREGLERAVEWGEKAVALDDFSSYAHAALASPYGWLREYDKAISEAERAVSLDPNSAYAYLALGSVLYCARDFKSQSYFFRSLFVSVLSL